jgi:transcriptional regulator
MYVPRYFENKNDKEVKDFIRHNSFGVLVSQHAGKLWGTHIPFHFSADESRLYGHISKANLQWRNFNPDEEGMVIFTGPHTYVSPSWYDHENVPTWNYIAAHVYGTITIIEGDLLYQSLKQLVDKYESNVDHPVSLEKMSAEYVKKSIQGLVGFEIKITEIKAAFKLSQNRDDKNHHHIIHALEKNGDHNAQEIAAAMRKNRADTSTPYKP